MQQRRLNLDALTVNSSLGFGLGFVLALFVYQLGLIAGGLLFGRGPEWYLDRVEYTASGSDFAWAGGVVLVLFFGWALASVYRGGEYYDGTRLAVLWVMLHAFRQGLMSLLRVPFSEDSDVARALAESTLPEALSWVFGVLGAAGLLGLGLFAAPALLRFARSPQDLSSRRGRSTFLGLIGLVAWLVGSLLVLPLLWPASGSEPLRFLPWSGAFLIVTLLMASEPRDTEPAGGSVRLSWGTLLFLAILIAVARAFGVDGVPIGV